jgi:hypothetical protein
MYIIFTFLYIRIFVENNSADDYSRLQEARDLQAYFGLLNLDTHQLQVQKVLLLDYHASMETSLTLDRELLTQLLMMVSLSMMLMEKELDSPSELAQELNLPLNYQGSDKLLLREENHQALDDITFTMLHAGDDLET